MSDQKPREFGISNTMSGYRVVDKAPFDGCQFHVIEKSAYDEAVKISHQTTEINKQFQGLLKQVEPEMSKLRADLDLVIEALRECVVELKKYDVSGLDRFGGYTKIKIENARETIAKLLERK